MNWLAQHIFVLRFALRRLFTSPATNLLNVLVMGVALSLPAGMYLLLQNVQDLVRQAAGAPQISVFLNMHTGQEDIERIGKQLRQHRAIAQVQFVPRDQALQQLRKNSGVADVIGGLTENPLPDAFIIYPKKTSAKALETLRGELEQWPKLEHVQLDSAWAHKLDALIRLGRRAVLILAILLSFALLAVTFNTVRLQMLTQRDEIAVSRLIGATSAFIRRPFLYFGMLQGLLSGALAWLIITCSLTLVQTRLAELAQLYESSFLLQTFSFADSLSLLLFSTYLGWIGAWLSVTQHLRQSEHR
ncbi:MAG: permease-like cell division protein FtsX [Pseudomonadota bacterium]